MSIPPEYPHDPSQLYGQQPPQHFGPQGTPPGGHGPQGYAGPGNQPYPPQPGFVRGAQPSGKGFFGALFDFSFRDFVTPKIIKVLFILWLTLIVLFTLIAVVGSFVSMGEEPFLGIVMLFSSLLIGAIYVLLSRVGLEILIVVFRISEDLTAIRKQRGL
ncbi:hypothetical protein BJF83_00005 [Nocardiopsis sp. CNR-923]|uniref:DUF4282 domain-containing protein n=1 Tax=Nocardiopsis sp. CNR-923 TaxID=1904965 RepID=UPI00095E0B36|nr:DUF4282 domain-containing protein [Nocardiopsis sp. CNR-923]OLT29074.1 hypothetical protein BJF83_00005 [Nocardiopsis sp. CNR-923]